MERKGFIEVLPRLAQSMFFAVSVGCAFCCTIVFAAEMPSQTSSSSPASSSPPQTPPPVAGTQPPTTSDSSSKPPPDSSSKPSPPPSSDGASVTPEGAATAQQPSTTPPASTPPASESSSASSGGTAGNVPVSSSPEVKKPISDSSAGSGEPQQPVYEYQATSRPDPYKPFIAPKTVNPSELLDEDKELTGMQLFEPAQLSLVGVMDTPKGRVAMVEDATKKGYTITEGQLIGKRGKVTEIQKDQVLVTETAQTRGGEEIKTVVSMKMKRDGDGK